MRVDLASFHKCGWTSRTLAPQLSEALRFACGWTSRAFTSAGGLRELLRRNYPKRCGLRAGGLRELWPRNYPKRCGSCAGGLGEFFSTRPARAAVAHRAVYTADMPLGMAQYMVGTVHNGSADAESVATDGLFRPQKNAEFNEGMRYTPILHAFGRVREHLRDVARPEGTNELAQVGFRILYELAATVFLLMHYVLLQQCNKNERKARKSIYREDPEHLNQRELMRSSLKTANAEWNSTENVINTYLKKNTLAVSAHTAPDADIDAKTLGEIDMNQVSFLPRIMTTQVRSPPPSTLLSGQALELNKERLKFQQSKQFDHNRDEIVIKLCEMVNALLVQTMKLHAQLDYLKGKSNPQEHSPAHQKFVQQRYDTAVQKIHEVEGNNMLTHNIAMEVDTPRSV